MDTFKRLLKLTKPYKFRLAIAMICMTAAGALTSGQAYIVKPALDDIFLNKNTICLNVDSPLPSLEFLC